MCPSGSVRETSLVTVETRHRRKDGTVFPVELRLRQVLQGGRRYTISLARDITERKRVEEERERLYRLEVELARVARLTTLGELTTSIAHEVGQPLGAMVASAGAGARWLAADPPAMAEARAALDNIVADGKRARQVIAQIRALAKRQAPRKDSLDVNQKIVEVSPSRSTSYAATTSLFGQSSTGRCRAWAGIGSAAAGAAQPDRERGRGDERCRRSLARIDDRFTARRFERRASRSARFWQRPGRAGRRASVRGVLHDEGRRYRHRPVDQPLDHRGARRAAVGERERPPRGGLRFSLPVTEEAVS